MSDPITLGLLFTIAWQGILGTQVNDAAKHLCLTGIKKVSRNGKIVNHDLEKALKRSFLKAQQQIASECKQEIDPKNTNNRESFSYSLQDRRRDFDWLKRKLEKLKLDLEQVDQETVSSGIPIEGLDEIELLLTATDELKQNRVAAVKQKLLEVALENCDVAPYKTKLEQELFALVSAYFAQEIKENEKVFQIFTGQTLTRIDTTTQEMYAWLEEIVEKSRIVYQPIDWRAICQQILDEKEQQRLSSNQLTFGNHQIDDVYVPLGLVERHKVTQRHEDLEAEEGSDLYREKEVTQTFEHREFLEQVLRGGSSPKSNGKRLGIIGEPGAGKTTLLRQIANWVAAEISEAIVIWVSLADLQGKDLESYLFDSWLLAAIKRVGKAEATADIKDDFLALFNAERVWLVLDGADEMAAGDGNPLAEIQRQIRTGGCVQRARIVLSCRQNVWDAIGSALDTFDTYRTLEFSYPEQVEMFIDKWFQSPPNPPLVRSPPNPPLRRGGTREEGEAIVAIATLVDLIRNSANPDTRCRAASSLGKIDIGNSVAIATLIELTPNYHPEYSIFDPADSLLKIMKGKHFATAVSGLKNRLTSEIYKKDFGRNERCHRVIWECAQNMTYPDFYQAWHTQPTPTNFPIPDRNHRQNTDIPTLLKQLKPTDKAFPVPLNIRALEGETDTSAIAQELCTQLYQTIFPTDTDIPAIRNAPEFKRLIPQLKNRLQKQHIALILHSCPCENALSSFTRKLADSHMGIHIAWITDDTPLELPLTGFAVDGEDLLEAVQDWIAGIGA